MKNARDRGHVGCHCQYPERDQWMTDHQEERKQTMAPDHVAPAVTYMASAQCTESGVCIEASGGGYGRTQIVRTAGVSYDAHEFKDADWFASQWDKIADMSGATAPWTMQETREAHYAAKKA